MIPLLASPSRSEPAPVSASAPEPAPAAPVYRTPWDPPAPLAPAAPPIAENPPPRRRGRRPNTIRPIAGEKPVWLYHHLTVSGPSDAVESFAAAARGAGVIPWRFDAARFEEDVFLRAAAVPAAQRGLSIAGCHILARQFRTLVEAHRARAAARVGRARNCPFDLHALLPVPADILARGENHPEAMAWLATHWGVTDPPRQVALRPGATAGRRLPRGHAVVGYGFFTAGETPHPAIATLAARFPGLRFVLLPRPAD